MKTIRFALIASAALAAEKGAFPLYDAAQYLAGETIAGLDEDVRAAIAARNEIDPAFVVCARCDLIGAEGGSFAEALDRGGSQARHDEHTFHWRVACPSGGRQRRDGHVGGAGGSSPCQMIHTTSSLLPATSTGFGSMRAIIV